MKTIVAVLGLAVAVFSALACGGGKQKPTSTPTVGAIATAVVGTTLTVQVRRTGIAEVDAVIDAVLSADAEQLRPLIAFQSMACTATPQGIGPFYCSTAEPEGTRVGVIPVAQCEGSFLREDQRELVPVDASWRVYAAYRTHGGYALLFERTSQLGRIVLFGIQSGQVNFINFGCGDSPVGSFPPEDAILPPP